MKKLSCVIFVSFLFSMSASFTVLAADEKPKSLRDACLDKVSVELDLNSVRDKLRSLKAKDGQNYYEVYQMFVAHRKSSRQFDVIKELADDIQLSATFAIGYCVAEGGDMEAFQPETSKAVYRASAHEHLNNDTKVKVRKFQSELNRFVKNYYNVYVAR
ncbi:MAG: hypothetical protein CMF61_00595 [Magnetococcales bacterium]|nr:hypothetical protein [Magnetococcales bacterium]